MIIKIPNEETKKIGWNENNFSVWCSIDSYICAVVS